VIAPRQPWLYLRAAYSTPTRTFTRPTPPARGTCGTRGTQGTSGTRGTRPVPGTPTAGTARGTRRGAVAACLLAAAGAGTVLAGCGAAPAARPAAPAQPPPLTASYTPAAGTGWAIVEMGGSAAQENNFWELFARPAGAATWKQVTPAGVADNGGLVVAASQAMVTGFLPSQDLTFSPLAASSDNGATWSPAGPVSPGLADVPDALAAGPGGSLIALTSGGAELGQRLGAAWACEVTGLTAAAFGGGGAPMLAAGCARAGTAGIFARTGGAWQLAGPAVPAWLAREDIEVLRLTGDGRGLVALLRAGTGPGASVVAAWWDDGRWALSPPLRAGTLRSTAIGPGGSIAVILNGPQGATLAGPGASWHALPALPRSAAALALGTAGRVDAITARGGTFTDWRLAPAGWSLAQTVQARIPYGSSS